MTLQSGSRLGPYEVISRIGAGGMGEVWRARDTRLERDVAIKVLPAGFASNAQLKLRFEREAKMISQLNHPHICVLHDVGEARLEIRDSEPAGDPSLEPGAPRLSYLVMELLEGESLADRLPRGPLPLPDLLKYGAQIAEALDRAHRAGVVHRDLKPGNVVITRSGAKLLDFGLARSEANAIVEIDGVTVQKPLTQEGAIVGTFQYMAPEQLEGLEADARTDIFALGCVLYEMATGHRAFDGKTKASLIAQIVGGEPRPLRDLQPLTPPALDHVVERCLRKDPDERWQSALDIAEELRWISEAGSQAGVASPVTLRRRRREKALLAAGLMAGLTIAAIAGYVVAQKSGSPPTYRFSVPGMDRGYRSAELAMISPDGSKVVFEATGDDQKTRLWIRSLDSFETRPIEGTENAGDVAWSPDSRSIAFVGGGKVHRVAVNGGPVQSLAETSLVLGLAWGADGQILAGSTQEGIRRISASGGAAVQITTPDGDRHDIGHTFPTFLPGGRRFLFTTFTREPNRPQSPHRLMAGSIDSPATILIGEVPSRVEYVEGHLLFVRNGILLARPFDLKKLSFTGDPVVVAENVYCFTPVGRASFSVSDNGIVTVQEPAAGFRLRWLEIGAQTLTTFSAPPRDYSGLRFTRDGSSLLAAVRDDALGTFDLWAYGVDRETATRLTYEPGWEAGPLPSPDGSRIYYASDRSGVPDIFVKTVDSPSDDLLVVSEPGVQIPLDVSPDGRFLLYSTSKEEGMKTDLWVVPLDGSGDPFPFVRSPFAEMGGRFSPDGRWIAYASDESGRAQVYIRPFPGPAAARQISISGGAAPDWSPDGSTLFFRSGSTLMAAGVRAPNPEARVVYDNPELAVFRTAPDGERILLMMQSDLDASPPTRVIVNWPKVLEERPK